MVNSEEENLNYIKNSEDPSSSNTEPNENMNEESYSELRKELIDGNMNDLFKNKDELKTLYSNEEQRLKSLDASIQSIRHMDLYNYQKSVSGSCNDNSEGNDSEHTISVGRLKQYVDNNQSLKQILQDLQEKPELRQKIKAYEYKIKNKDQFELNNIKIDDLIKLDISKTKIGIR